MNILGSFRKESQVTSISIQTYTCLHNLDCCEDISLIQTLKFKNKNIIETEFYPFALVKNKIRII